MGLLRCVPPFAAGPSGLSLMGQLEGLLGPDGYLWVADDLTAGVAVSSWVDRIHSLPLAQATGSKQPDCQYNAVTLRNEVVFDGTDDFLPTAAFGSSLAQPNFVYMSADADNVVDGKFIHDGIAFGSRHALFTGGSRHLNMDSGLTVGSSTAPSGYQVFSEEYNSTSSELWLDGVSIATGNSGTNPLTGLAMCGTYDDVGHAALTVALIAIEPTGDTAKREQIESIINLYYNDIYTMLMAASGSVLLDASGNPLRSG